MPHDDASLMTSRPGLSVAERRVLLRIYQHPLTHNLSWHDVGLLFGAIGTVAHPKNGHVVLTLGSGRLTLETAQDKTVAADGVMALRHLLTQEGWTPDAAPADTAPADTAPADAEPADAAQDLVIVIDHAEARIYPLAPEAGPIPADLHHLHHSTDRSQHDTDREEGFPADQRFFDAIAKAVAGQGRIVVIGHGTGQSNEAGHLIDWLATHCAPVHDRVACTLTADLSHASLRQLLDDARRALPQVTHPKGAS